MTEMRGGPSWARSVVPYGGPGRGSSAGTPLGIAIWLARKHSSEPNVLLGGSFTGTEVATD